LRIAFPSPFGDGINGLFGSGVNRDNADVTVRVESDSAPLLRKLTGTLQVDLGDA
jgi:hypothetical protein